MTPRPARILLCSLALVSATGLGQVLQEFHPERQQPVRLVMPELSAEVVAGPVDPMTAGGRIIEISALGSKFSVPLPLQFHQVSAIIQGPPGKLVVVGMYNQYGYEVGIIDVAAGRLVDRFGCYIPAVSPDGQYVAFTKLFPSHGRITPEDHAMLYVVAYSRLENRPPGLRKDIIDIDDEDVGFGVYPVGIGNREGDNVNVPPETAHTVAGYYFWKDPNQYFFADRTAKEFRIICVAIAKGKATVRGFLVPPAQFGGRRDDFPSRLEDVSFEGDSIKLTIRTNVTRSLVLKLADFANLGSVDLARPPAIK